MTSTEESKIQDVLVNLPLGELLIPTYAWSISLPTVTDGYVTSAPIAMELPSTPAITVYAKVHNVKEEHFELLATRALIKVVEDIVEFDHGPMRVLKRILLGGVTGLPDTEYYLTP